MKSLIGDAKFVKIRQIREKLEIFTGWETANKYSILDEEGRPLGYAAEREGGPRRSHEEFFQSAQANGH